MGTVKSDAYQTVFGVDRVSGQHQNMFGDDAMNIAGIVGFYYRDELARRIIDVVPEEMVAPGFQIRGIEDGSEFDSIWTGLKIEQQITDALCWSRLFGQSAIMVMLDDGKALQTPATPGAKLESVRVYEKEQIDVDVFETNPRNARFGLPRVYKIKADGDREFRVHYTRLHIIDGNRMPNIARKRMKTCGVGVLSPSLIEAIQDYNHCHWLATQLLTRKQQAVWKARNLAEMCDDSEGEYAARLRIAQVSENSGVGKPIGIDAETEEYEVLNSDISGVDAFISMKMDRIVELSGIHEIILRNKNTGGVSASQNTALQTFYKMIDRKRKDDYHPILEFLLPFIIDEQEWTIEFEPLSIPTDAEKADILNKVSTALNMLITNQTLDVEESRDTLESMDLGIKLKENPGKLPTREDVQAAKDQLQQAQDDNQEDDDNGNN